MGLRAWSEGTTSPSTITRRPLFPLPFFVHPRAQTETKPTRTQPRTSPTPAAPSTSTPASAQPRWSLAYTQPSPPTSPRPPSTTSHPNPALQPARRSRPTTAPSSPPAPPPPPTPHVAPKLPLQKPPTAIPSPQNNSDGATTPIAPSAGLPHRRRAATTAAAGLLPSRLPGPAQTGSPRRCRRPCRNGVVGV